MTKFSNQLTETEAERLAILLEEMGEAQQCIGKILRHGYESEDPTERVSGSNRWQLEREIGDVQLSISLMIEAGDISDHHVVVRIAEKAEKIKKYLHHQEPVPNA